MAQDTFDDALRVRTDEVKQIITDVYSSTITFEGRSRINALTSEAIWQIKRTYKSGNITKVDFANDGLYTCVWDDRFSEFNSPFFVNARSLEFDGVNDYLIIDHNTSINFERTNAWTFACWAKPAGNGFFYYKRSNTTNQQGISITRFGNEIVVIIRSTSTNLIGIATSGAGLTTGTWKLVQVSYDGSSTAAGVVIRVNNVVVTNVVTADTLSTTILNTDSLFIGAANPGNSNNYAGDLDEITLWNVALNSSQSTELYNGGEPGDPGLTTMVGNLITWLRMGDGDEYPIIKDQSGANDATMVNMTRYDITDDVP